MWRVCGVPGQARLVVAAERWGGALRAGRLQRSIHLNLRLQLTPYKEVQLIRALSSGRQQWSPNAQTATSGGPAQDTQKGSVCVCVFMGVGEGRRGVEPRGWKMGLIPTSVFTDPSRPSRPEDQTSPSRLVFLMKSWFCLTWFWQTGTIKAAFGSSRFKYSLNDSSCFVFLGWFHIKQVI